MNHFLKDLLERAVKTVIQSTVAAIGTATAFGDVQWKHVVSVVALATLTSVLTSLGSYHIGEKGNCSCVNTGADE